MSKVAAAVNRVRFAAKKANLLTFLMINQCVSRMIVGGFKIF